MFTSFRQRSFFYSRFLKCYFSFSVLKFYRLTFISLIIVFSNLSAQIQVGDTLQFWSVSYIDWQPGTAPPQRLISADCQLVNDSCYVFVDLSLTQAPSQPQLMAMASQFDSMISKNLSPLYGPIPDEIDQDRRVFILIIPSEGWTGYFDPAQEMADSLVFQRWGKHSSEREIIYLSADAFLYTAEIFTLVHEFGHMLHWGQDHSPEPPLNPEKFWEDAWIDEAFAMFAGVFLLEDISLPDLMDDNTFFVTDPDLPLIHFLNYFSYNQVKLWLTFMYEHYGGTAFITRLIQDQANGISGVRNTLSDLGYNQSFEETFEHWVLTNYLDNEQYLNGYYGYQHYNFLSPYHFAIHTTYPGTIHNGSLKAFAADYILCNTTNPAPLEITFQGDSLSCFRLAFILMNQQGLTLLDIKQTELDSLNRAIFTADSFGQSYDRLVMVVMNVDSALGENETAGYSYHADLMSTPLVEQPASSADHFLPGELTLYPNYPNPFNPNTIISWHLAVSSKVELTIYDLSGKEVAVLVNGIQPPGIHQINFNASSLASGIYIYRLDAAGFTESRKMILMR